MSFAHKIRVGVLRGGPSSEYDASLRTGETVLKNLPSKYEGLDIFISKDGTWHVHGREKSPAEALKHVDVAFVALHGEFGADGKVQRILEHLKIPFTGSGSLSAAVVNNKGLAKGALGKMKDNIKFAAHRMFSREEVAEKGAHEIFRLISHPSVVNGKAVVREFFDLETALETALKEANMIVIEELVEGKPASCAVVDGLRGEERYSFIPEGDLSEATKKAVQDAARAIHGELGLRHYSTSDFIIHPRRGVFLVGTEAFPKLSGEALLPRSAKAVGLSMSDFLDHVITMAML